MKKTLILIASICILTSCNNKDKKLQMEIDSLSSQIDSLSFEKYQMMDKLHQVENEYYLGKYSDERQDTLLRTMDSLKYDIKFKDIQIELRREKREKLNDIKLENEYGK